MKSAVAVLFPWRFRKFVPNLMLEVCSLCQHRCNYCAHGDLIAANPGYQLSLDELDTFIRHTEESKYFIENVEINGPGEPTLWKHFNEGMRRLYESPAIGNIQFSTNGQSLDRVDDGTWRYFSLVILSVYPSSKVTTFDRLFAMSRRYGFRIIFLDKIKFRVPPKEAYPDSLPALCSCHGPTVYGHQVFALCGPTGVGAAAIKGESFLDNPKYSREIGPDYLAGLDKSALYRGQTLAPIHMEICRYCTANTKITFEARDHEQIRDRYVSVARR
ncbi:MAG: hypothetical protein ABSF70_04580 [Terracidiphilus sp.]